MTRCILGCALIGLLAGACEKGEGDDKKEPVGGPAPGGELRIAYGDCAAANVKFVSGPRPQPFDADEVAAAAAASAEPAPAPEEAPSPDPVDDVAMGKKAPPEEGQYKMKRKGADPQLARKQALEQARTTGILGSAKLQQGDVFATLTGDGDFSSGLDDRDVFGAGSKTGFGPGGGGSGWGTIGTGRYGTIGHGSGTGSGGGMRGRSGPQVRIGQPTAQGDLDKNIIRRYIRRQLPKITYCYEKELLARPTLEGTVVVQFMIDPQGKVGASEADGVDKKVSACVAGVIRSIEFPKPKGGGMVKVTYPFTFRPAEGSSSTPPAEPPAAADPPPPAVADQPPPADPAPPTGAPATYVPGRDNPLAAQGKQIQDCLRKGSATHGALVVDLEIDAAGAVTASRTHGVDPSTGSCIAQAARKVSWKRPAGAWRCPLAFGTLSADAAPGVDITTQAVLVGKTEVASVAQLLGGDQPGTIEALYERLRDDRQKQETGTEPIAVAGPVIIRPVDQAPVEVVTRVLMSARSADADAVLAARRGSAWKPLRAVDLPVAPVPRGTGGYWSPTGRTLVSPDAMSAKPPVTASVLLMPDGIWLGLSGVNEIYKVEGHDWARFASMIAEVRKSALIRDRTDIEIAGAGAVVYGDLVKAIDALTAGGFPDWTVTSSGNLSVRFMQ